MSSEEVPGKLGTMEAIDAGTAWEVPTEGRVVGSFVLPWPSSGKREGWGMSLGRLGVEALDSLSESESARWPCLTLALVLSRMSLPKKASYIIMKVKRHIK